ncbi:phage holin family protein [Aquipuribacter sp. SD81]|uniref:phage holin family protein n=1 Tax=Aquipuribacter sp. SD81 TaxID=3127703 RepID=UPI003019EDAE
MSDAVGDVRAIVQHEKDLAKAEITGAAKKGGAGAALLVVAATLLGLGTVYLLIAAAEALVAAGMTRWGAFLVVGGAVVVLGLLLALVGVLLLKRVRGPQRTVEQGKGTVQDVKEALHHDDADGPVPAPAAGARTS